MGIDYSGFWTPKRRSYGWGETRLHLSSFIPIDQLGRHRSAGTWDLKVLGLRMQFFKMVALVMMSDHELSNLLKRNVVGLTHVVEKLSPTDTEARFERVWRVIQS
jgi:hypothetical protein